MVQNQNVTQRYLTKHFYTIQFVLHTKKRYFCERVNLKIIRIYIYICFN